MEVFGRISIDIELPIQSRITAIIIFGVPQKYKFFRTELLCSIQGSIRFLNRFLEFRLIDSAKMIFFFRESSFDKWPNSLIGMSQIYHFIRLIDYSRCYR